MLAVANSRSRISDDGVCVSQPEALSIERGRYLEVSYAIKVAVSGSLSSDVSLDLPTRIINFVSIDPPPGHVTAHPEYRQTAASLTKGNNYDPDNSHKSDERPNATSQQQAGTSSAVSRMASMDSLNINDLNRMYSMPGLPRMQSFESYKSEYNANEGISSSGSSMMSRAHTMPITSELSSIQEQEQDPESPPLPPVAKQIIEKAKQRQVRHQMSLDCIGTAIASAAARRAGHIKTDSDLSGQQSASEAHGANEVYMPYPTPLPEPEHVLQLDGLEEDGDDLPYQHIQRIPQKQSSQPEWLEYDGESEDEVDLVLQTKYFGMDEEEEELENVRPSTAFGSTGPMSPYHSPIKRLAAPLSPKKLSASGQRLASRMVSPTSPASSLRSRPGSPTSQVITRATLDPDIPITDGPGLQFGLATPASPVKKGQAAIVSPSRYTGPPSMTSRMRANESKPNSPSSLSITSQPVKKSTSMTSPGAAHTTLYPVKLTGQTLKPKGPSGNNAPPQIVRQTFNGVTLQQQQQLSSTKSRVAALEHTSAMNFGVRNGRSTMRKMPSMPMLRRPVSPSGVSVVSSISPTSLDWRLNGGSA